MDEAGEKKPVLVTREELYRQVWDTPMLRLGEQYGLSGNGLAKICDRLKVPYPPLGHWSKVRAGKRVQPAPLPSADPQTPKAVTITPTPPRLPEPPKPKVPPEITEKLQAAAAKSTEIRVPDALRRPHPSIASWIAEHERQVAADRRDRSSWGTAFQTKPFTELERREQRILDTLYKELEKRGFKIRGQAPYQVSVEIGKEKVEFTLRERIRQIRRPLNDEEKGGIFYRNQQWRQEKLPTGELIFTLKTHLGPGLTREWRDGERKLEEQIGDIVAVLSLAGPILEEQRQRAEEAARVRWEQERKRDEERAKQRQEHNRWRRFVELASRWEEACLAMRFIEALETLPGDPERTYGGRTASEWLTWARERCSAFDPLCWEGGDVWTNLASVASWEYRD